MKINEKCWCGNDKLYGDCHFMYDIKINELKKQGEIVPTQKMIKNQEQIEGIRIACEINSKVLDKVAENIRPGMTTEEIDKIVYYETGKLGGVPI